MDGGAWWAAVHGVAKSWTRMSNFTFTFHFHAFGEGNGNPLQCSCLENPKDGGAWWAAVYGVAQSRTWLKQLSSSSSRNLVDHIRHGDFFLLLLLTPQSIALWTPRTVRSGSLKITGCNLSSTDLAEFQPGRCGISLLSPLSYKSIVMPVL